MESDHRAARGPVILIGLRYDGARGRRGENTILYSRKIIPESAPQISGPTDAQVP